MGCRAALAVLVAAALPPADGRLRGGIAKPDYSYYHTCAPPRPPSPPSLPL